MDKTAFWALLALVLFLCLVVVALVIVIVKKFLCRDDNATPRANGYVVNDVVDGKLNEQNGYYCEFENKWHNDGYVEENILNSNYMMTTSC